MIILRNWECIAFLSQILYDKFTYYVKRSLFVLIYGGMGMKRCRIVKLYIALCLAFSIVMVPGKGFQVQAAEILATVHGTVLSGTNSGLLKLSTKEGYMEIKIDSGTDVSACKILLPDSKVSVSVSYGSDRYLHAVKISGGEQGTAVTLDTSSSAAVTGTIGEKSTGDILYVNTPQGEMQIKWDTSTNLSGCSILMVDRNYNINCARGSDAYMHAISISDPGAGTVINTGLTGQMGTTTPSVSPAPAAPANVATVTVTGTVTERTKESLLYLSTNGGEMQIAIDDRTDARSGMMLTPGNKLTVSCYRGSDAYMHAASIVGIKDNTGTAELDTSSPATVTGTVGGKSTESLLYLSTNDGEMQLKMDAVRSVNNCKVFVSGKKLTVTCVRGSDAYMHALDITGN